MRFPARPYASEVVMGRLLLLVPLVLLLSATGGREPAEHTVWEDEDEAREAMLDAAEAEEDRDSGVAPSEE